jgi:hypothetical protein
MFCAGICMPSSHWSSERQEIKLCKKDHKGSPKASLNPKPEACPNAGEKVYCDPSRGETYKESGVPLEASGVPPCTPVRAACDPQRGRRGI